MRLFSCIVWILVPLALTAQSVSDPLALAETALRDRLDRLAEKEFSRVEQNSDDPRVRTRARHGRVRLRITRGELDEAEALLEEMGEAPNAELLSERLLMHADIALLREDLEAADHYLSQLPILSGEADLQRKRLLARKWMLEGDAEKAVELLKGGQEISALSPLLQLDVAAMLYPDLQPEESLRIWERLSGGDIGQTGTQISLLQLARHALRTDEPGEARAALGKLISGGRLKPELEKEVYPVYIRLLEKEGEYLEAAAYLKSFNELVGAPETRMALQALRARNLIRGGEIETADRELKESIARWGDQAPIAAAQLFLARRYLEKGEIENSREAFQAYLSVFTDPRGLVEARSGLASVHERLEEFAKAELLYTALHQELPEDSPLKPVMLVKAADTAFAQGKASLALERYRSFLDKYPEHSQVPEVMMQTASVTAGTESLTDALNLLSRIRLKYPDSMFSEKALIQQAILLQQSNRPEQALGSYDSYLELYPEGRYVADAMTDKGITAYRLGLFELAQRQFKEVSRLFPDHPRVEQAQSLIGWTHYLLGENEAARKAGRAFIEKYPESPYAKEVNFWLAEMAFNRGDYAFAASSFQKLSQLDMSAPLKARAHYLAGRALLADDRPKPALAEFNKSRELDISAPFAVDTLFYTGDVLTELGQFDEAILIFDQLIRTYPDSYLVYAARGRLGDCQYTLGEQDPSRYLEALNSYRLVEESRDARLELRLQAMYKVGRTLNALDRKQEARRQQEKMIQTYVSNKWNIGGDAATWFLRAVMDAAQSYEQEGDFREAIRIYEKLRDSGLPQAQEGARRIEDLRREHRILF